MTLIAPLALALLAATGPVVWFFLRRPPVPRRAVSSLLLARALATLPQRSRRLPRNELVPLALVLGALLLLVLTLAVRPDDSTRPVVIVLDDSETSPLRDDATRAAVTDALRAVSAQRPEAPFTVVGTAPAGVRVDASTDLSPVLATLANAATTGVATDPGPLLEALCDALEPTILVIGHVQDEALPTACPARMLTDDPPPEALLLSLTATAPESTGDIWLHAEAVGSDRALVEVDGAVIGELQLTGDPVREGVAQVTVPPGATLSVRLADTDTPTAASTLDVPPLSPARTLVRTPHPDGYLATIARVHPRLRAAVLAPDAPAPSGSIELVLSDAPTPVTDPAAVVAIFGRGAPELGVPAGRTVTNPSISVAAPDDPVLALVELDTVHIVAARTLAAPADATILASTARGPIALRRPHNDGTAVVFGLGPADSDLALRTDFVHLVANLVDLAAPPPAAPPPAPARRRPTDGPSVQAAGVSATPGWTGIVLFAALLLAAEAVWLVRRDRRTP